MGLEPICATVAVESCKSNAAAAAQYKHFHLIASVATTDAPCERTLRPAKNKKNCMLDHDTFPSK